MNTDNTKHLRIAFRVDASPQIGTGHFMRCLTLAIELRKVDCEVWFICRDLPAHFVAMLHEKGITLLPLTAASSLLSIQDIDTLEDWERAEKMFSAQESP